MTVLAAPPVDHAPRIASTDIDAFPVPQGREEEWRFAPTEELAAFMSPDPAAGALTAARHRARGRGRRRRRRADRVAADRPPVRDRPRGRPLRRHGAGGCRRGRAEPHRRGPARRRPDVLRARRRAHRPSRQGDGRPRPRRHGRRQRVHRHRGRRRRGADHALRDGRPRRAHAPVAVAHARWAATPASWARWSRSAAGSSASCRRSPTPAPAARPSCSAPSSRRAGSTSSTASSSSTTSRTARATWSSRAP